MGLLQSLSAESTSCNNEGRGKLYFAATSNDEYFGTAGQISCGRNEQNQHIRCKLKAGWPVLWKFSHPQIIVTSLSTSSTRSVTSHNELRIRDIQRNFVRQGPVSGGHLMTLSTETLGTVRSSSSDGTARTMSMLLITAQWWSFLAHANVWFDMFQ